MKFSQSVILSKREDLDRQSVFPNDMERFSKAEANTIPRVNNKLYKLQKTLKQKEVETLASTNDIAFVHSLSALCKEIMVNNIDLPKLDISGDKLLTLIRKEEQHRYTPEEDPNYLMMLSQLIYQTFTKKQELVKQEEEYSYAFGGFTEESDPGFLMNSSIHQQQELSNGKQLLLIYRNDRQPVQQQSSGQHGP